MSKPYEERNFICDRCTEEFTKEEMIEEDDFLYCKSCYEKLLATE